MASLKQTQAQKTGIWPLPPGQICGKNGAALLSGQIFEPKSGINYA